MFWGLVDVPVNPSRSALSSSRPIITGSPPPFCNVMLSSLDLSTQGFISVMEPGLLSTSRSRPSASTLSSLLVVFVSATVSGSAGDGDGDAGGEGTSSGGAGEG